MYRSTNYRIGYHFINLLNIYCCKLHHKTEIPHLFHVKQKKWTNHKYHDKKSKRKYVHHVIFSHNNLFAFHVNASQYTTTDRQTKRHCYWFYYFPSPQNNIDDCWWRELYQAKILKSTSFTVGNTNISQQTNRLKELTNVLYI